MLAEHLGRSKSFVKQLIAERKVGYYQERPHAAIMIPEPEVRKWLQEVHFHPSARDL